MSLTLYSVDAVKVQEIMDAFTGVYLKPEDGQTVERPQPTKLQIEQLKTATKEFFTSSSKSRVPTVWIDGDDLDAIREFLTPEEAHMPDKDAVCVRCRRAVDARSSLAVKERDWHLDLAILCLRHLNSALFQKRYGLSRTPAVDGGESGHSTDQLTAETQTDTMCDRSDIASGGNGSTGSLAGSADDERGDEEEDSIADDESDKGSVDETIVAFSAGEDWPSQWPDSRYEIDHWYEHALRAEDLWPDEQERQSDSRWQTLMHELDKFAMGDVSAFVLWQRPFFKRYLWFNDEEEDDHQTEPWKPLHIAAYLGLTSWARHLIDEHGADPKVIVCNRTTLQAASEGRRRPKMLHLLLERGADPNLGSLHLPAFHYWLFDSASLDEIDLLMRHGADPNRPYGDLHCYPLHCFACDGDDPACLERLLTTEDGIPKPDINVMDGNRKTPLHQLLSRSEIPIDLLKAFIKHGADINKEDNTSTRPLQIACDSGKVEVVEVLLDSTTDVDDPDTSGRNAMHMAARAGHTDCIDALIRREADPHAMDKHGRTPLFYACSSESGAAAKHVIELLRKTGMSGCEVNKTTVFGQTPLLQAARKGLTEVVETLLDTLKPMNGESKSSIDCADKKHGRTALHQATRRASVAMVSMLLDAGAGATIQSQDGKTPLDICRELWALSGNTGFEEIARRLMDASPPTAPQSRELAATAAMNGSKKILEKLRACGADLSAPDRFGWTPLGLARRFGRREAEDYLRRQFAWIHGLPTRWSTVWDDIKLSEDGTTVTNPGKRLRCILTEHPLPQDLERYYFEFTSKAMSDVVQEDYPTVAIGFATHGVDAIRFPGWRPRPFASAAASWGYHGDDGRMCTNVEDEVFYDEGRRYKPGDTVGAGYDSRTGTIWFTRNGELLQPTFDNVHGRLFPIIGSFHAVELHTNFGPDGFLWKDDPPVEEAALPDGDERGGEVKGPEDEPKAD